MHSDPIAELPLNQRLQLMETLWDSLVRDQNNKEAIPAWHEKVLTDRAHLLDSGLEKASPWAEAKQRIRDLSIRSTG